MASTVDVFTVSSSLLIRFSVYIFLRWIPTSIVPPVLVASLVIYLSSFFICFRTTLPWQFLSDEIDIIVKETIASGEDSESEELGLLEGTEDGPLQELDLVEPTQVAKADPQIVKTLLTGLPSPTSSFWTWVTFGINIALVSMVLDLIFHAPILYPAHDLSFARVGYVSDTSARILVREPHGHQLPIQVSYRYADSQLSLGSGHLPIDTAWKSVGKVTWLSNETDYTSEITIDGLQPDTRYQYAFSNNHSGFFHTAPKVGHVSSRNHGKYTFLHTSCIKPRVPYNPLAHPLSIHGLQYLAQWIPQLQAHFLLFLGDFIYIDVPIRLGRDVETYRKYYRQMYSSPDWQTASNELPWLHVIDDHEIANDWSANTTGVYQAAADPYTHYHVAVNPPTIRPGEYYFSFTQGPASFFLLDTRRYRSPENRDPNDPAKTMLGKEQLHDLLIWLREPAPHGVHWKVVVSSIPFTKNWQFGNEDTWGGYLVERQIVLEAMWDVGAISGVGVVVLSGDRHEFAATSFPPPKDSGLPVSATVHEFSASPLSMFYLPKKTYRQLDERDVCIKYLPDGNSKFGAIEISSPLHSDQSILYYRLFVDGVETWTYTLTAPPATHGSGRRKDAGLS